MIWVPKWCNTCRPNGGTTASVAPTLVVVVFCGTCSIAVRLGISRVYSQRLRNAPGACYVLYAFPVGWRHGVFFSFLLFPTVFIVIQLSTAAFLYSLFIQVSTHLLVGPRSTHWLFIHAKVCGIQLGKTHTHFDSRACSVVTSKIF